MRKYIKTMLDLFLAFIITGMVLSGCGNHVNTNTKNDAEQKQSSAKNEKNIETPAIEMKRGYNLPLTNLNELYKWEDLENTKLSDISSVWFGCFPQKECARYNTEEELWQKIINADYDKNDTAEVSGKRYQRMKMKKGNAYQYYEWEPIEWIVMGCDDKKITLLSKNVIYNMLEASEKEIDPREGFEVDWEKSQLRSWLNGYESSANRRNEDYTNNNFIHMAFSEEEQDVLLNLPKMDDVGKEGNDKAAIWFFDADTASREAGFQCSENDLCSPAEYAEALGAGSSRTILSDEATCDWAVCTRREDKNIEVSQISHIGSSEELDGIKEKYVPIRPVICIDTPKTLEGALCGIADNSTTDGGRVEAYEKEVTEEEEILEMRDQEKLNSVLGCFVISIEDYLLEEKKQSSVAYSYEDIVKFSQEEGKNKDWAREFIEEIATEELTLEWKSEKAKGKALYLMYIVPENDSAISGVSHVKGRFYAKVGEIFSPIKE